ncbi:odorant receptor Or2-like [Topomyia yanbarensis]|uniref:odorant receptor Or2-like n=1 Tax=Topomyia yanbarensis TaxID=2498891 RepID=UPI00273B7887|nr:odorant receptor Or2-like [Topomyia yanbarensis]
MLQVPDDTVIEMVKSRLDSNSVEVHKLVSKGRDRSIYLRPNSSPDLYNAHSSAVQQILDKASSSDSVLIVGDYNLPHLRRIFDYDLKCYLPENATTEQEIAITETIVAGGLCQINSLTNANGRTLDLAFVNYDDLVELLEPPTSILKADANHKPFVLRFNMQAETEDAFAESADGLNFDFNRCNFDEVSASFNGVDWFDLLSANDLDHAVAVFYGTLYEMLRRIVPKKRVNRKTDYKYPWWNSELRRPRNILRKHRKRYFRPKTDVNKAVLRRTELQYETARNSAFGEYISHVQNNLRNNPSTFWNLLDRVSMEASSSSSSSSPSPLNCPIIAVNVRVWYFWSFVLKHDAMRYICIVPLGVMNVFMLADLYRAWGNIDEVIINAFFVVLCFNTVLRGLNLIYNRGPLEQFLKDIAIVYKEIEAMEDENIQKMVQSITKRARTLSFANMVLGVVISACYVIYPLFTEGRGLPYGMFIPGLNILDSPQWEILYLAQMFVTLPGCCIYIPFTSFFATCTLFGLIQIKTVQHQLQEFKRQEVDKGSEEYNCKLVTIIQKHQRVITYVAKLNSFVTYICLVELVSFGTMLCALLFLLVIIENHAQIVIVMAYIFMMVSQIFAFYWHGNELREESMAIALAAYSGPWFELDTVVRKKLLMIILRAQRPLKITVGNVFPLTLEMFQSLLNASYSYFTLLRRVYKR